MDLLESEKKIKCIDLSFCQFPSNYWIILKNFFNNLIKLQEINFSGNNSELTLLILESVLKKPSNLNTLLINDCYLTLKGDIFKYFLQNNNKLIRFEMNKIIIEETFDFYFLNCLLSCKNLKNVILPEIKFKLDEFGKIFSSSYLDIKCSLQSIEFGENFYEEGIFNVLEAVNKDILIDLKINKVSCNNNEWFNEFTKLVKDFSKLDKLSINNNELDKNNLGKILVYMNLKHAKTISLEFKNSGVECDSFPKSSKHQYLISLDFSGNTIIDMVMDETNLSFTNLKYLNLSNCSLNDYFLVDFKTVITNFIQLETLDLSNNYLKFAGISDFLETFIDSPAKPFILYLHNNRFQSRNLIQLSSIICELKFLRFLNSNTNEYSQDEWKNLNLNKFVNSLEFNLEKAKLILNSIASFWSDLENFLYGKIPSIKLFEIINVCCLNIEKIDLGLYVSNDKNFKICQNALKTVADIKSVEISNIILNYNRKDEILKLLTVDCKSLTCLKIVNCGFSSSHGQMISDAIEQQFNLRELNLQQNDIGSDTGISIFKNLSKNCTKIKKLNFQSCQFDECIEKTLKTTLKKFSDLEYLNLSQNELGNKVAKVIFTAINEKMKNFDSLFLSDCKLDSNIKETIVLSLKKIPKLKYLDLSLNDFSIDLNQTIFKSLNDYCNEITEINLENCGFSLSFDDEVGDEKKSFQELTQINIAKGKLGSGKTSLFQKIYKNCRTLIRIKCGHCDLDNENSIFLIKTLGKQNFLQEIIIPDIKLEKDIGHNFLEILSTTCSQLIYLNISNCQLNSNNGLLLPDTIMNQKHLKKLNISFNNLLEDIGEKLFQAIALSKLNFEMIEFSDCGFDNRINFFITEMLKNSPALVHLNMSVNNLSENSQQIFEALTYYSNDLQELNISSCGLNDKTALSIISSILSLENLLKLNIRNNEFSTEQVKHIGIEFFGKNYNQSYTFLHDDSDLDDIDFGPNVVTKR